jgi:hypothetical protein
MKTALSCDEGGFLFTVLGPGRDYNLANVFVNLPKIFLGSDNDNIA